MSDSLQPHGPPASSVHGILQARILEWAALPSSWDLPHLGVEPGSLLCRDCWPSESPQKPEQACTHRLKLTQLCGLQRHCSGKLHVVLHSSASNTLFLPMSFGWLVPSGSTPTKCRTSSKLTFLVTFLHPDSQPPLDTNSTVSRFASNTWKSHFFFCEQSYLRARNSVPVFLVKPVGVKQTQLRGSTVLHIAASAYTKHLQGLKVLSIPHFWRLFIPTLNMQMAHQCHFHFQVKNPPSFF